MGGSGFKCGFAGVLLQTLSIPAAVAGHGITAALMASAGTSLTYVGLKSVVRGGGIKPLSTGYRYLMISVIIYSLVAASAPFTPLISNVFTHVFAVLIIPATIASQLMYSLSYNSLRSLWRVNVEGLCNAFKALGIVTALTAGIQLVAYIISPKAFAHVHSLLWLIPLTLFTGFKCLEGVIWVRIRSASSEGVTPGSWVLAAFATLLMLGSSVIASGAAGANYQVVWGGHSVIVNHQLTVNSSAEVIKVYTSSQLILKALWRNGLTRYLIINPPYESVILNECPEVKVVDEYPITCVGEALMRRDGIVVNEYIYGPTGLSRVIINDSMVKELGINLLNNTLVKASRLINVSVTYSLINGSCKPLIKVLRSGGSSRVVLMLNESRRPNSLIKYLVTASAIVGRPDEMLVTCKCLSNSPPISPLPPYPLLSSEALRGDLAIIPYSIIIALTGLTGLTVYYVVNLARLVKD